MDNLDGSQIENLTGLISSLESKVDSLESSIGRLTGSTQNMSRAISEAEKSAGGLERAFSRAQDTLSESQKALEDNLDRFNANIKDKVLKANNDIMRKYSVFFSKKEKAHLDHNKGIIASFKDHLREQKEIFSNLPSMRSRILFIGDSLLKMFTNVFGFIAKIGFNIFSILTDIGKAIVNIGKFLVMLPLKVLENLLEIGNSVREEFLAISQTLEDTQEQISGTSKTGEALQKLATNIREVGEEFLVAGGLKARIFGFGLQGQQAMITKTSEKIAGLKTIGNLVGPALAKNALEVEVAMQSLGMSIEDAGLLMRKSMSEGIHPLQGLVNAFHASSAASKQFGVDQKLVARGMNTLRNNVIEFSHLSEPELAKVTAQAAQLGVEAEGLVAIFNKFTTFESAAESAALLSQTFGMAIDAMDIIRAEDPLEILNQFREGMEQTGRSFSDLNRHEKALLSQYTGLSGEMLQTAMSFDGVGLSYEEMQKRMEESSPEHQLKSAVKEMTASVKEFMNMGKQITNPFQAFTEGIKDAILKNSALQKQFVNISNLAKGFYEKIVTSLFGGEEGLALQEKLSSALMKFQNLLMGSADNIADIARKFLTLTTVFFDASKGTQEMSDAFEDLQKTFFNNKIVQKLIDLGKLMIGSVIKGFIKSLPTLVKGFTQLLSAFNNIIKPGSSKASSASAELGDFFNTYVRAAWNDVNLEPLMKALLNELKVTAQNTGEGLKEIGKIIGKGILEGMKSILPTFLTSPREFFFGRRPDNPDYNPKTPQTILGNQVTSSYAEKFAVGAGIAGGVPLLNNIDKNLVGGNKLSRLIKTTNKLVRAAPIISAGVDAFNLASDTATGQERKWEDWGSLIGSGLGSAAFAFPLTAPMAPVIMAGTSMALGELGAYFDRQSQASEETARLREAQEKSRQAFASNVGNQVSHFRIETYLNADGRQLQKVMNEFAVSGNGNYTDTLTDGRLTRIYKDSQEPAVIGIG